MRAADAMLEPSRLSGLSGGKSMKLFKVCGERRVIKWCEPECAKRVWPVHIKSHYCITCWAAAAGSADFNN